MIAILRDGSELKVGDDVVTNFHRECHGHVFVIDEINEWPACESKAMVLAHMKSDPTKVIRGAATLPG